MARAIWKGAIGFGLVHIPVALKRSMEPVGYKRINKVTGKEMTPENIVKDMSVDWQPDEYRDTFEEKIMQLVETKGREGKIEDVETSVGELERKSADVIDLTELLKRSLSSKSPAKGRAPARKKTSKAS
ncbi:hypothetical protein QN375_07465 [Pseudomonas sp. MH9.2]|uniref:hypothetical protein n=1 Tax=unclassified Pseudomonas TaxID=196821 RepID=UPI002AC9D0E5|nr:MULTISPECIES: hypothetical protein [unclassified Pseudomonas]MEB0006253.1 hypothetical protein [Pseudomonas sp. RTB2]MEB0015595.1 hypothetical protein [Pseudomonas sp. RTB3]MEB0025604.1 hypothetical protein [Pseudomonas sp. MH9.2]MEB0146199.1 hypothetical protein [Pseudomonas sp. CCC2.2]MEB0269872.1 hypothetical protein [Pseudomonas sp. 5B4]